MRAAGALRSYEGITTGIREHFIMIYLPNLIIGEHGEEIMQSSASFLSESMRSFWEELKLRSNKTIHRYCRLINKTIK